MPRASRSSSKAWSTPVPRTCPPTPRPGHGAEVPALRRRRVRVASTAHGPALLGPRRRRPPGPRLHGRAGRPSRRHRGWPRRAPGRARAGPLGDAGEAPRAGRRGARAGVDAGLVPRPGPALLRLRHRRGAAGGARRGLADGAWDQNAGALRVAPGGGRRRGGRAAGCSTCSGCPPSERRLRHRRPDGATSPASPRPATRVLPARAGTWRSDGLFGAPPIAVVVGERGARDVDGALRLLGLRPRRRRARPADGQGRMRADALSDALAEREGRRSSARRPAT